jgi:ATP-dependent RNA helicase DDX10/DBP4
LIFASTCKQVRFIYEAFRKFRLATPLYELQGHQNQKKRMAIYFTFCEKKYGILVCTNIASRGLDFPMVDWVVQLDIPEDVETYVHRVGRTARFKYEGKSLAFVADHELGFVDNLKAKNIKIHKITQNHEKYFRIDSSLQSICS